jgi:hypothetical protein
MPEDALETDSPLPAAEAARRKGCSTQTIYNALNRGELNEVNFPGSRSRLVATDEAWRSWTPKETGRRVT